MLEFCCAPNSRLCDERYTKDGCECYRITEKDDAVSASGIAKCLRIIIESQHDSGVLWDLCLPSLHTPSPTT